MTWLATRSEKELPKFVVVCPSSKMRVFFMRLVTKKSPKPVFFIIGKHGCLCACVWNIQTASFTLRKKTAKLPNNFNRMVWIFFRK